MATIKLTKVNIAADKYFAKFDMVGYISTEEIDPSLYSSIQIKDGAIWVSSASKISFDTPTGNLSDNEYATQLNGFHWVKIRGYAMTKIDPGYITNNILSSAGIAEVKERSVAE